tara:strand:+ start:5918 stop:6604 length:687 start_codon:yes stop_codon:yes gene_type:complete
MIKSISHDQHEIIKNIQDMFVPGGFELDPTYSKGKFYVPNDICEPKLKFDLYPQDEQTIKASAECLPIDDGTISSIMFDPPFVAGHTKAKPTGIIGERFHGFRYVSDLWEWYDKCLIEFNRILKKDGILAFKCQDTVSSGKNWFSHCYIMERALVHGFYPRDMFVLLAKSRIIGHNHRNTQNHARKFHSYFWVFEKKTCRVPYDIDTIVQINRKTDERFKIKENTING